MVHAPAVHGAICECTRKGEGFSHRPMSNASDGGCRRSRWSLHWPIARAWMLAFNARARRVYAKPLAVPANLPVMDPEQRSPRHRVPPGGRRFRQANGPRLGVYHPPTLGRVRDDHAMSPSQPLQPAETQSGRGRFRCSPPVHVAVTGRARARASPAGGEKGRVRSKQEGEVFLGGR
jgi:hypothetical protein